MLDMSVIYVICHIYYFFIILENKAIFKHLNENISHISSKTQILYIYIISIYREIIIYMASNITYEWYYDSKGKKISSFIKDNDIIIGEFSLHLGKPGSMSSGGYPSQLYIEISEEYQGQGYSNILLKNFHDYVYYSWDTRQQLYIVTDNSKSLRPYAQLDDNMILYIDSDVSSNERGSSFWRNIGLRPVKKTDLYHGYELSISLKNLLTNIYNKNYPSSNRSSIARSKGGALRKVKKII